MTQFERITATPEDLAEFLARLAEEEQSGIEHSDDEFAWIDWLNNEAEEMEG